MPEWTTDLVRKTFLEFFQSKGHTIIPSSSLIPHGDPTLLEQAGDYNTPCFARRLEIVGSTAYVADDACGLRILDVAAPTAPSELGFYDTPGLAQGVAFKDNYVYVADGIH